MSEIDPREAAARAMGDDDPPALPAADVEDDAAEPNVSSSPNLLARLLDGTATGPTINELRREYDLQRSESLILRGVLRWAGADGMPPIGEISLGGILKAREVGIGADGSDVEDDEDGAGLEGLKQ